MQTRFNRPITVALCLSLGACTANDHAIFHKTPIAGTDPVIVTVDAKQRAIIGNVRPLKSGGTATSAQTRRFCSEPSPDAISVIAQSLSAGGAFGQKADPRAIEASLNFALSTSESASTIGRTQTTNTLRELMFRTCERYMNGAINELEMSVQAARDQRLIVSILAIEQLTGAVTPPTVVVNTNASGTAGASGAAIVALDSARKESETAAAAALTAKKAYDETNGTEKICEADPVADANKAKCSDAKTKLADAKAKAAKTAEDYQLLATMARSGGVSVNTGSGSGGTGAGFTASPQSVATVASTVEKIVRWNIDDGSETLLFCFKAFDPNAAETKAIEQSRIDIREMCARYVATIIEGDRSRAMNRAGLLNSIDILEKTGSTRFEVFWPNVSRDGLLDADLFKAYVERAGVTVSDISRNGAVVFRPGMNASAALEAFSQLPADTAIKLSAK